VVWDVRLVMGAQCVSLPAHDVRAWCVVRMVRSRANPSARAAVLTIRLWVRAPLACATPTPAPPAHRRCGTSTPRCRTVACFSPACTGYSPQRCRTTPWSTLHPASSFTSSLQGGAFFFIPTATAAEPCMFHACCPRVRPPLSTCLSGVKFSEVKALNLFSALSRAQDAPLRVPNCVFDPGEQPKGPNQLDERCMVSPPPSVTECVCACDRTHHVARAAVLRFHIFFFTRLLPPPRLLALFRRCFGSQSCSCRPPARPRSGTLRPWCCSATASALSGPPRR